MSTKRRKQLTEREIDEIVITQAKDNLAWEEPIRHLKGERPIMANDPHLKDLPITIDPEIMSGVPVIRGTRVPVQTLFDYLADGYTVEQFLHSFPTVERVDALAILEHATEHLSVNAIR